MKVKAVKRKSLFKKVMAALVSLAALAMLTVGVSASGATSTNGAVDFGTVITSTMMDGLMQTFMSILPVVIPVMVVIIGVRLAIRFFRSMLS